MTTGLFVTGTDTGIGKTRVAVALLHGLVAGGLRAVGMKPVAAGFAPGAGTNDDVLALAAAGNVDAPLDERNPYAFADAIAPHVAAARTGVTIDLARIAAAYRALAQRADAVVVEGAGGSLVPIGPHADMLDVARALGLPVVLVVGVRLGCLHHALASELAIRMRGLELAGWVANRIDPVMEAADASVAALDARIAAPRLADLGWNDRSRIAPSAIAMLVGRRLDTPPVVAWTPPAPG